ncbi:DUF2935 domain-containing protein [Heliophilum fasciatum]|uniref:DUF2935 family protein n=1 Tax=Heliophilum fasciatum TaxID=35700 RepID=A0A4R2RGK4_9FIRM|nr:DUF2935 domain-containing protein [Heliophilum fasciatum]MCW2279132.1 hypothetical protein [Heliophilum fasciatum]TCP61217.1 DUF2935 family protein [Heliophilum fasciatum]
MLSSEAFVQHSLELHLFFARIMKEHGLFMMLSFTPKDQQFAQQADYFRQEFGRILTDTVTLANGVVRPAVIQSGEVITPYTLNAEQATGYFTGVQIATDLTQAEAGLTGRETVQVNPELEQRVDVLNRQAIQLINGIIQFKTAVLSNVRSCRMITQNYPSMIDHILHEAKVYLVLVQRAQSREDFRAVQAALEQEVFWNHIMSDHAKFIRGMLDPVEKDLIALAERFAREFDRLTQEAERAMKQQMSMEQVTQESIKATAEIRDFKAQGTQGILDCKIQSIILPLLSDHVLREANHYLRVLRMAERG